LEKQVQDKLEKNSSSNSFKVTQARTTMANNKQQQEQDKKKTKTDIAEPQSGSSGS
jgi:hypothetical protein